MNHLLKIIIAFFLIASSLCEFIEILPSSLTSFDLNINILTKYYVLKCNIESDTDTILRFTDSINSKSIKIYIYWTQKEAEDDEGKFINFKWSNENSLIQKEFLPHFKYDTPLLQQLFVIIHCKACDERTSFSETFQMTNELIDEIAIKPGVKYNTKILYSKKELKYVMTKKPHIAFRFIYTPITEQELTIETYVNKQVVSKLTSKYSIELSRSEEYASDTEYHVIVRTNALVYLFELQIELSEFIQPFIIDPLKKIELDFSAKHDLYYYLELDYKFEEEQSIVFSIQQNEGQDPVIPTIYSKDVWTNRKPYQYDQLVPKKKEESLFQIYNKDNTHFILYFKQSTTGNNLLFININYNQTIQFASLAVSPRTETITDTTIKSFTSKVIDLNENVPYYLKISSSFNVNILVYVPKENSHRIFLGNIMNLDKTISTDVITSQLHAIKNKKTNYATYEFFIPQKDKITIYLEPISSVLNYRFDYRNSLDRLILNFDIIGETQYFIESSKKTDKTYYCFFEQIVGKYEYIFTETITITEGMTSLLPKDTDSSKGIEELSTSFMIYGIKVISPGQQVVLFREETPKEVSLPEFIQYNQLFTKDNEYQIKFPSIQGKETKLQIFPIKFRNSDETIQLSWNSEEHSLKEDTIIKVSYDDQLTMKINPNIQSSVVVGFKIVDSITFTEIDANTKEITASTIIMKFTDENVSSYSITIQKNIKSFKYDIGIGEDQYISSPSTPTFSTYGGLWLLLQNLKIRYGKLNNNQYYYLTMVFNEEDLPIPIIIRKKPLPEYSKIEKGEVVNIKTGQNLALIRSNDYSNNEKNIFVIVSSCIIGHDQEIILSSQNGYLKQTKLTTYKTIIEHLNIYIPLYLKYNNNEKTAEENQLMVSYNYISDEKVKLYKGLLDKKFELNTTSPREISWISPSETISGYMIFAMKKGTNTSSFDNECYLNSIGGNATQNTMFKFNNIDKGKYVVNVIANNKDSIQFSIIGTPVVIDLEEGLASLKWLWIVLGVIGGCLLIGLASYFFFKKRNNGIVNSGIINNSISNYEQKDALISRESA